MRRVYRGRFAGVRTRASARDTLILAFSHKGRRDLVAIRTWFRMADLVRLPPRPHMILSARTTKSQTYPCKPMKGEGILWSRFTLGFGRRARPRLREDDVVDLWISAKARIHRAESANDGRISAAMARYSSALAQCRRAPIRAGGSRPPPAYPPKGHHQRRLPPPDAAASRVCSRVGTWIGWRLNSPI